MLLFSFSKCSFPQHFAVLPPLFLLLLLRLHRCRPPSLLSQCACVRVSVCISGSSSRCWCVHGCTCCVRSVVFVWYCQCACLFGMSVARCRCVHGCTCCVGVGCVCLVLSICLFVWNAWSKVWVGAWLHVLCAVRCVCLVLSLFLFGWHACC